MYLYLDKENLVSLVSSQDKASVIKYTTLIKENLNIHFNFPKDEIQTNDYLKYFFSTFGSGVVGALKFSPPDNTIPERPLKSNFYNTLNVNDLSSLFFLNDSHVCTLVEQKGCIIVSKVGDELLKLKEVFQPEEMGETLSYKILSWSNYLPKLPLSDIIICDNHYFKTLEVYQNNNNEIIRALSAIPKNFPVNIVIIVKDSEIDARISLITEQGRIKELVRNATGSSKSAVTIVTTFATHDRALITNYYRVKHGCSFNIKDNGIKHDVSTEIKTHVIKRNRAFTIDLLNEYQKIVANPVQCIGDKVCNYLAL